MKKFLLLFIIFTCTIFGQERVVEKGNIYYVSNAINVKIKTGSNINELILSLSHNKNLKNLEIKDARQAFIEKSSSLKKGEENLSRIYTLTIDSQTDPLDAAKKISRLKQVEWAEPKYVHMVSIVPDDSLYVENLQQSLQRINAPQAWDITTGDSNVVIAIVDTGIDWDHPDLAGNIFRDANGNKTGWDFGGLNGTPDNDPREDKTTDLFGRGYHGTLVAGIASAVTNNKIGVASIGFNCSLMPVKVSRSDMRDKYGYPLVYYGFDGIKYAADNGAKVINCSWGGFSYSKAEQEIIDYAVSKGVIVIAAAGNENSKNLFYPASYNGVLSVGWLNTINDTRSSAANHNTMVDVMAPGTNILTTTPTYSAGKILYNDNAGGSSLSSPMAAGLAGLVLTKFPNYTPLQVAERIRVTCDDVYYANPADSVRYLLGRGRINAYKALSEINPYSIRATKIEYVEEGNSNGLLESGESASIKITFTNFLSSISNVKISLSCSDPAVSITDSIFYTGSLNTLNWIDNNSNRFKFSVMPGGPYDHTVNFLVRFSSDGYTDYQWISTRINPTYDNFNANNIELTITSKGALGFNDFSNNIEGIGLRYKGQDNVLFEGALMYGTSSDNLMDVAREGITQSTDFITINPVKVSNVGSTSDKKSITIFNDDGAGVIKLGIQTTMSIYGYADAPNDNFIIVRTKLKNNTQTVIDSLYAGYYYDFDIPGDDSYDDMVAYDVIDNFGYFYDSDNIPQNTFIGITSIDSDLQGFYAINQNVGETGNVTPNSDDGFNDTEKYYALSNGFESYTAGPADVSCVISSGPYNLNSAETIDIAFVLACGSSVEELRATIKQGRTKWIDILSDAGNEGGQLPKEFTLFQNYPNPFNPSTIISYKLPLSGHVTLKIYDMLGREIATLVDEYKQAGIYNSTFSTNIRTGLARTSLSSGVYFYRLTANGVSRIKKMILLK